MKLIKIISLLFLTSIVCYLAAAAPDLDYLTVDDCRACHGDGNGNTEVLHHQYYDLGCVYCHDMPLPDDWRNCYDCHADFDHHEDAGGKCSDCHDDRQLRQQRGKMY
jgi:hypothetical protein